MSEQGLLETKNNVIGVEQLRRLLLGILNTRLGGSNAAK
jgi:hypothetical protein